MNDVVKDWKWTINVWKVR